MPSHLDTNEDRELQHRDMPPQLAPLTLVGQPTGPLTDIFHFLCILCMIVLGIIVAVACKAVITLSTNYAKVHAAEIEAHDARTER